jgi:hypothetical protein
VTRRERTEEATLDRLDARFGVDGTDWEGPEVRELRTLLVEADETDARRARAVVGSAGWDASDAVLNAVEASLVVETLETGLEASGTTDPALLLRMVDA